MRRHSADLLVVLAVVLCASPTLSADPMVTHEFTGVINRVLGTPPFPVSVGGGVWGTFTYDLAMPDSAPSADQGLYYQSILDGLRVRVDGTLFEYSDYYANVWDKVPGEGPWDAFSVAATTDISPWVVFAFQGVDRDIFHGTGLPEVIDLDQLQPIDAAGVVMSVGWLPVGGPDTWRVDFTLLTITLIPTLIPEPFSLAFMGIAFVGVVVARARRRLTGAGGN